MADVKTIKTTPAVADFASTSGSPLLWDSTNVKAYMLADGDVVTQITGAGTGGSALTRVNDTNITLTLGGSPTTALLNAASITAGWTGTLAIARGGTGAATANANTVLAGPTSGGSGTYSFRPLVTADLPAGTGTVTSVNVTTANGVSATGGPITTTGSFTFTLGAITPTSVAVTGSSAPPNGLYLPAANTLALSANSVQRLTIDPTNGAVINATTGLSAALSVHVNAQGTDGFRFYNDTNSSTVSAATLSADNSGNFYLGSDGAKALNLFTNSVSNIRVYIAGATSGVVIAGNVGINQLNPGCKVHVTGGNIAVDGTHIVGSYGVGTPGATTLESIQMGHGYSAANVAGIGSFNGTAGGTVRDIAFFYGTEASGGTEKFRFTTAGVLQANTITVNSGTTATVFNSTATTINAFGAATTLNIGNSGGTATALGNWSIGGTISVTGHTTFEGVTSTGATGTGKIVYDGTPTLVTPNIGAATGTSLNLSGALTGSNLTVWSTFTPNRTGWTDVGSATVTGRKCKVGNLGYFQVKVVPGVTTATVAGTSYIDLPFTAAGIGGDASMTDLTTFVSVGNCVVDATNSRVYVPAQAATSDSLNISGWFEI